LFSTSLTLVSFSSFAVLLGLNNISPERDGTEGKKKGAFSGFFGGSIGLLRTWKLHVHDKELISNHPLIQDKENHDTDGYYPSFFSRGIKLE